MKSPSRLVWAAPTPRRRRGRAPARRGRTARYIRALSSVGYRVVVASFLSVRPRPPTVGCPRRTSDDVWQRGKLTMKRSENKKSRPADCRSISSDVEHNVIQVKDLVYSYEPYEIDRYSATSQKTTIRAVEACQPLDLRQHVRSSSLREGRALCRLPRPPRRSPLPPRRAHRLARRRRGRVLLLLRGLPARVGHRGCLRRRRQRGREEAPARRRRRVRPRPRRHPRAEDRGDLAHR